MRVAVAQIEPKLGAAEVNLDLCLARLDEAASAGCSLLVLPECSSAGYVFDSADEALVHAQEIPGPFTEALATACRRLGIVCVAGMLEREGDVLRNTAAVVGPDGLLGRYRKTHLPYLGVDRFVTPGDELGLVDTPAGRIGLEICYDLRFPELYRAMGTVDLLVVPAAFTHTTGQAHWELLLRARAVENLCYVLAAAQGGTHPSGRRTWGDSMVVDPWGAVLERLPEGPGVVSAEMDTSRIAELRASLPALEHRRFF